MLVHTLSGLVLLGQVAAQTTNSAPPPPAGTPSATAPAAADQVDLKGIAQALATAKAVPADKCGESAKDQQRRSAISALGTVGGLLIPVPGAGGALAAAAVPVATLLTDKLLSMLDCKEQQQAAHATLEAMRGGVGTEVSWKSESRPNVTGSSKVTAQQKLADGSECLTVTDVIIVEGEETTVPKKMCRAKGASGYVRA
jgi:hypothetical protein